MTDEHDHQARRRKEIGGVSGGVYGLAFIGAVVYYIQHATTFWEGAFGFLKALLWPAVLVHTLMEFLKM
jgi:hypothetical protein